MSRGRTQTDRDGRRAERLLRDSEARLRAIITTAADGIITIDESGTIESANPAAERMFGYRPGGLRGRSVSLLMPEPDASRHAGYVARYLRTGHARIIGIGREVLGRRRDGGTFPLDLAVSELRVGGRRMFTGILRDVGERLRLEREILEISGFEQRRIGRELHDGLCQLLTAVDLGLASLRNRLASTHAEEVENVDRLSDVLQQAVGEARALAKGLNPVHLGGGGLVPALSDLAEHVRALAGVACTVRVRGPQVVLDDSAATHVYRIAQEAINNAVRHGRARRIRLTLSAAPAGRLRLAVRDNGVGFDPRRADPRGLGLHTMRYRARMIGGSLELRSTAARGTSVSITFTPHRSDHAEQDATRTPTTLRNASPDGQRGRIAARRGARGRNRAAGLADRRPAPRGGTDPAAAAQATRADR